MAIPEAIRKVERPRNTIVVKRGNGSLMYAVVERVGCKRIGDRNVPVNGYTVGHIIQGAFVACSDSVSRRKTELKDYADAVLIDSVSRSLLGELYAVYSAPDAMKIYVIALLRVCYPGVPCCRIDHQYETSWASTLLPGISLGKNTLSPFLQDLGKSYALIVSFMRKRVDAIAEGHHIAIDGTLKEDNSSVNSLSTYSRKSRVKGTMDITVVFAYNINLREPVCSKVFRGNVLDCVSYQRFLSENGLTSFESDLDSDPLTIYKMYDERWLIEECFRYYKNVTNFDDTKVHSDYSVYGSEFVNFISSVMTARLLRRFEETGLFSEMTYNDIMSQLSSAKKVNTNGNGEWEYVRTTRATEDTLARLGLLPRPEETPRKRGRPRKEIDPNAPKRKRGRPRKNPS